MDGKDVGLKIKINGQYLKTKNNKDRLFTNIDFAKSIAFINGANARDYELELYMFGSVIPYGYTQLVNNKLEFFAVDETNSVSRYSVEQSRTREYTNFGYIIFDNGAEERIDKEIGTKRNKQLVHMLIDAIESLNQKYGGVDSIIPWDKGINVRFKHTTAQLEILTNSGLMDLNQWRKGLEGEVEAEYSRCYPFVKQMDKFVTFYSFVSKELYEPYKIKTSNAELAKKYRELIIEELTNNWDQYNKNPKDWQSPPTFKSVFYKTSNKILSN